MTRNSRQTLLQVLLCLGFLYLFFVSIELMSSAFRLLGKKFAEDLMASTSHPFVGLFIGIFVTSIIQSSSSTTSILVGMVAGGLLPIRNAIPIAMGANIGTTVTSVIVSLGSINRKNEFSRAFPAAVLHDFYSIGRILIFFPLECYTHVLERTSVFLAESFKNVGGLTFVSPLQAVVRPAAHGLLSLVQKLISTPTWLVTTLVLILSLALLFLALTYIVILMKKLVIGRVEGLLQDYLFDSMFRSFVFGLILTAVVQSSSVTISLMVPIVAAGILTLNQIFPYIMGAAIGTTVTAILAAFVTRNPTSLSIAFAHMLLNIAGATIFLPLRAIPIRAARTFGNWATERRVLALCYTIGFFYLLPLLIILITKGGF